MGSSGALSGLLGGAGRVGTGAASEPEIGRVEDSYGCLVVCFSGLPGGHGDQGAAELGSAGHRAWAVVSGRWRDMASASMGESAGRVRSSAPGAPYRPGPPRCRRRSGSEPKIHAKQLIASTLRCLDQVQDA